MVDDSMTIEQRAEYLRDRYAERVAICRHHGGLTEDQAREVARAEVARVAAELDGETIA